MVQPGAGDVLPLDGVAGYGDHRRVDFLILIEVGVLIQRVGIPVKAGRYAHHIALLLRQSNGYFIFSRKNGLCYKWSAIVQRNLHLGALERAVFVFYNKLHPQLILRRLLPGKALDLRRGLQHLNPDRVPAL